MVREFFIPALERAVRYDRGVGYFSSGWVRAAADGMERFASTGGHARLWVQTPILSTTDWDALYSGDCARSDPVLRAALLQSVADLGHSLAHDTLTAISWMVADGIVEFRLAMPRERLAGGEFHDKFGVFTDSNGERISFNGSYNDSLQGLRNYESIKVFPSWEPAFASLVKGDAERFEKLWNNEDPNVRVFLLPDAVKAAILQLRTTEQPYGADTVGSRKEQGASPGRQVFPSLLQLTSPREPIKRMPCGPGWRRTARECSAMATGAGKTATALVLASKVAEQHAALVLIVVVPYINLANQWVREMARFNLRPVCCFEGRSKWVEALQSGTTALMAGTNKLLTIVVTNRTFLSPEFQGLLRPDRLPHFLIADEVHNLGASQLQRRLDQRIQYRLGLSATPRRHLDDDGTAALLSYFGGVVFEFTLAEAIAADMLCRYLYYPVLVDLTDDEGTEYWELSEKIARFSPGLRRRGNVAGVKNAADPPSALAEFGPEQAACVAGHDCCTGYQTRSDDCVLWRRPGGVG